VTKLEQVLDHVNLWSKALDKATRKPRKINRERIIKTVGVVTTAISVVALVFPQVRGLAAVANVVNKLQETVLSPKVETDDTNGVGNTEGSEQGKSDHPAVQLVSAEPK